MDDAFAEAELGPKMRALNPRERKFVWHYLLNGGNGSLAAKDAGYSDKSEGAKVLACKALQRDRVIEAVDEVGRKQFRGLLIPALTAARLILEDRRHPDHAKVTLSVLSRLGLAERSGVDVNVTGEVTLNHTDAALEQLRALRDLGVPQEKLVEIFGYSGLTRYEKMLEESDRKRPRLIEGTATEVKDGDRG